MPTIRFSAASYAQFTPGAIVCYERGTRLDQLGRKFKVTSVGPTEHIAATFNMGDPGQDIANPFSHSGFSFTAKPIPEPEPFRIDLFRKGGKKVTRAFRLESSSGPQGSLPFWKRPCLDAEQIQPGAVLVRNSDGRKFRVTDVPEQKPATVFNLLLVPHPVTYEFRFEAKAVEPPEENFTTFTFAVRNQLVKDGKLPAGTRVTWDFTPTRPGKEAEHQACLSHRSQ